MAGRIKRTTITDVAKLAGVSPKTVSRVLNDEPHVTAEVRERVNAASRELNYHPNILAQGLVKRRSYLLGLVYENPSPSYVVELQMGVLERLKRERYRLIVIPVRSVKDNADEVVGLLRSAALGGVVLGPPASDHPVVLRELEAAHMPFARISPTHMLDVGPVTLIDDVAAAREMAAHVLSLGHRDIAIIKGDPTHPSCEARSQGYAGALKAAGVTLNPDWVEQGMYTHDSGLEAGRRLFARAERPTAILAMNDDMAVGAMMAAREAGLSVPDDISIVGFDDSEVSRIVWPRLTTVRQPVFDMAACAADAVIAQIEGEKWEQQRMHAHQLLVRDSSAPPPR